MNSSIYKTLIALLLALKELPIPLSRDEQAILQDVGQQLDIDPDDWDFIKEQITELIEANYSLNQIFQAKIRKLNGLMVEITQRIFTKYS